MESKKLKDSNVLIIGDTHLPFEHMHYLEFCKEIQYKCRCKTVVHIGDLVDNHSISYHEHDPNGWSPIGEMEATDKHLEKWYKAFPAVKICRGNHDLLVDRKGKTLGLPKRCFMDYRDIWSLPKTWEDDFEFVIDNVLYKHGTGFSGRDAHVKAAERSRMKTIIGHTHSTLGGEYIVSSRDCIFAVNAGCGIDARSYAFAYGKDFPRKPVLGCAIVQENGKYFQTFKM
jgi:predicted phosphodiesterase